MRFQTTKNGLVCFAVEMIATFNETSDGKTRLVSGFGNVAQHKANKIIKMSDKVPVLSDTFGYV